MIPQLVAEYYRLHPTESDRLRPLLEQLQDPGALNDRKNFKGHLTGGAFVLSPDRTKLLVIYHKLFDIWVQPGGHWEAEDESPLLAAQREAEEETGVKIVHQVPTHQDSRMPFDIQSHMIKNRPHKHEPAHMHHDFKYVFLAQSEQLHLKRKEVNILQAEWLPFTDPRIQHMGLSLEKLQQIAAAL